MSVGLGERLVTRGPFGTRRQFRIMPLAAVPKHRVRHVRLFEPPDLVW